MCVRHDTFLGVEPEACTLERSRVVLLRVPYDRTVSYQSGAGAGPDAILRASSQVELWDMELDREPWTLGIHTPPALEPTAAGPAALVDQVERACAAHHAAGKFVFALGGEHTVAVGAARAAAAQYGELTFLQIDAHLDLRPDYEGTPYSHACAAARLLELGRVVAVGPRVACPEEMAVVEQHELQPVWGHELYAQAPEAWIERVLAQLGPRVYVTFDVDGLDPAVMPATGTPVPGGLGWYPALELLRRVGQERQVVACDLCELSPQPGMHGAEFAAAQLTYKMIGYFVR